MTRVGIVGLGYVGLPLGVAFAEEGLDVVGVDVDASRIARIASGSSYVEDVADEALQAVAGRFRASTDGALLADCDAVILCLPTPLDGHRNPDLSAVISGAELAAAHLGEGTLLVLESTTYPGTTREVIQPIVERGGRKVGTDVFLAFSPERVDPGNPKFGVRNTPRVLGGITAECSRRAAELYRHISVSVHVVSSPESAEMAKIIENTYRAVNIALVNEMAILADRMGIDIWEAIGAASTKPFGFMPFWPGPGLGGHCIPVDPFYLTWRAKAYDLNTEFVELAGRINEQMPRYAVQRVARALNDRSRAVRGSTILILGMAYKGDVGDLRESPSIRIAELLREHGALVEYHDPHVPEVAELGMTSVELTPERLAAADCVVIATNHRQVDLDAVVEHARVLVDLRNAVRQGRNGAPGGELPANVDVL